MSPIVTTTTMTTVVHTTTLFQLSGSISNLLFANSHNDWHNWGSHGKAEKPEGPRNHVKPAYSRSRSIVSWSDC